MEIPSTEVQNDFEKYLKFSQLEDVVITKNGRKIAVIKACSEDEHGDAVLAERAEAYAGNPKMTYEEFLQFSEGSENRYEFIGGEVYLMASPSYAHQSAIEEILSFMHQWFKGRKCRPLPAPFDVTLTKFDRKNVVEPDIVVICDTENIDEKGRYFGTPPLLVEVLSDSTRNKDLLKKYDLYAKSGVREYWIVNPRKKEVFVYEFEDRGIKDMTAFKGNETLYSGIFQGMEISLEQIFTV